VLVSRAQRAVIALALLLALTGDCAARSHHPKSKPQAKTSQLSEQRPAAQPSPTVNPLTPEQITKAITDGVEAAAKQYEANHPALPPDNSGWWFNFWLVVFTGGLVAVGGAQCFLIFWTLKATQVAARAAQTAAEVVPNVERAYLFFSATTCDDFRPDMSFTGTSPDVFQIKYRCKNSGRTPALLKKVQVGTGYLKEGFPKKDTFIFDHELETVLAIGADAEPPANTTEIAMMGDEYDWAKKGVGRIFFWAKLTYLDVFRVSHETGVCAEWHFGQSRFVVSKNNDLNYYT
jgi:hypothetical protein